MDDFSVIGVAHRGLHNLEEGIVENSHSAFDAAIKAGVGIELDIQMSGDRVPMVFHDETLTRLAGIDGRLSFMKSEVLRNVPYKVGGDRIMTLDECLTFINSAVPVLIEVKSHWTRAPEMEEQLVEILGRHQGPYHVMSFDPFIIRRLKELGCNNPIGLVTSKLPAKDWPSISEEERFLGKVQFDAASELAVDFIAHEICDLDNEYLEQFLNISKAKLFSWTVRSKSMLSQAIKCKATPIFELSGNEKLADFLEPVYNSIKI